LTFYRRAETEYNVQSPFLFDFVHHILDIKKEYYAFRFIEKQRKSLLKSRLVIPNVDYGARGHDEKNPSIHVSDIARKSVSSPVQCRILFQMIDHYSCKNILELGTSLGISSAYMAAACLTGRVTTCEGNPHIADLAYEFHKKIGFHQIKILTGAFEHTLPAFIESSDSLDFVFIDGHHKENPTVEYFELIIQKCHNESIIVLDDIYWSPEMTRAWHKICQHPQVTLSIDLYYMGVIFLRKELSRQNISFLTYKYKPWKIGLFG
jgi:predicted O-methyltransferase YrrM